MSLISTVAWASSSRDNSSVVPVRAAWCSAEKLWGGGVKGGQEGGRDKEMRGLINHTDDFTTGESFSKPQTEIMCVFLFVIPFQTSDKNL